MLNCWLFWLSTSETTIYWTLEWALEGTKQYLPSFRIYMQKYLPKNIFDSLESQLSSDSVYKLEEINKWKLQTTAMSWESVYPQCCLIAQSKYFSNDENCFHSHGFVFIWQILYFDWSNKQSSSEIHFHGCDDATAYQQHTIQWSRYRRSALWCLLDAMSLPSHTTSLVIQLAPGALQSIWGKVGNPLLGLLLLNCAATTAIKQNNVKNCSFTIFSTANDKTFSFHFVFFTFEHLG